MKTIIKSLILGTFLFVLNVAHSQSPVNYTTPGTYTWTVPPCVTSITVQVWGGGGGGGGAWVKMDNNSTDVFGTSIEACAGAGGGGGGGFSTQTYTVVPGQTYTIVVGAGGIAGASATTPLNNSSVQNGGVGGTSSFSGNSYNLSAAGGNGGIKAFSYNPGYPTSHMRTGGSGGSGGVGSNYNGGSGSGGTGDSSYDFSGAGGGGAGTTANGGNANSASIPHTGGTGGLVDGGPGGDGRKISSQFANGIAGTVIGGGGSGGVSHTTGYCNPAKVAQGGAGARGEVRIIYTVSGTVPTQPSVISGNTTIPCGGATGVYSVINDPAITYTWTYSGTGTVSGSGNSITLDATTGGTLTVTPSNTCGNGTPQTLTITMDNPPTQPSAITGNTVIACGGATGTYSVTNVPGVNYVWTYSGTGTITGSGSSITLNATTGGTLTVTPSNACGNGTPRTLTITLDNPPAQPSTITGNTVIACGGATGTYSVTNVAGVNYAWTYSGTGTITGSGNSITLNATTGGTLTVTPSNACGNGTPQTLTITMDNAPAQPSTITGNTVIACGGATGTYSVTNVVGVNYTWTYSGTGTITGSGNSVTLNATTGGALTVTPSNACGNGTPQTLVITMDNTPAQPSTITGNTVIACSGATGTYSVTNVPGVNYTWTYSGTGTITGTGNSITLNATSGGTLTVTPSNACGNGTPQTLTITATGSPAQPSVISGNPIIACGGATGTYSVTNVPGVNYTWTYSGTGTITGTGNSITLNATTGGTLTVTPSNACGNGTPQTITITTGGGGPAQPSNITGSSALSCNGTGGTYSVTNVPGVTYTWTYSGTGTIAGTGNSITLNATTGGTLTVTPSDACGNGTPQIITIGNSTGPSVAVTTSTNVSCAAPNSGSATVAATGGTPGYTYTWSPSGGTAATATNLTAGSYTVTVTDNAGCTGTAVVTIAGAVSIAVNTTATAVNCGSKDGTATATATGGSGTYTYTWTPGNFNTPSITNLAVGVYTVTVTDANGCTATAAQSVGQNGALNIQVNPVATVVDEGTSVNLNATISPYIPGVTYTWTPPAGLSCTDCPNPIATPDHTTVYNVAITTPDGCVGETTSTISIKLKCGEYFVPSIFSPNGDGQNDQLMVYGKCINSVHFRVYDRWGELVFESKDQSIGWDGVYKGKLMNSASFVYIVDINFVDDRIISAKGNVSLVR